MFALIHNRKAPSWEENRDGAFSRYSYKAKPVSLPRRASVRHADYVGMFSAHDSTGAVAADQLIHLIRRRKVEVKFDRVLQAGGTEAVTETAASVTDAQTAFTLCPADCPRTVCGQSQNAAIFTYRSVRFSQFLIADTDCPSVIGFLFLAVSS